MSNPIVQVDWKRVAPFIKAYFVVLLGEGLGFAMVALADQAPIFLGWAEVGTALAGGLVMEILLEYGDVPPSKKNQARRRLTRIIVGMAYGLGAINLVSIVERIGGGLLG